VEGEKSWRIFNDLLAQELQAPGLLDPKVMLRMQKFVETKGRKPLRSDKAAALGITKQAMDKEPLL
jgi:hypothetical protein